jgi:hypothetical protein
VTGTMHIDFEFLHRVSGRDEVTASNCGPQDFGSWRNKSVDAVVGMDVGFEGRE